MDATAPDGTLADTGLTDATVGAARVPLDAAFVRDARADALTEADTVAGAAADAALVTDTAGPTRAMEGRLPTY